MFKKIFRRRSQSKPYIESDVAYDRYQNIVDLVADLSKAELNKLIDVINSVWDSYKKNKDIKPEENSFNAAFMVPKREK